MFYKEISNESLVGCGSADGGIGCCGRRVRSARVEKRGCRRICFSVLKQVRYQMYHALGSWLWGSRAIAGHSSNLNLVGWLMVAGIVLFSGSSMPVFDRDRTLGAITTWGLCFLAGWAVMAWKIARARSGQ